MAKKNSTSPDTIDCACVIHGLGYDWVYVEKLYNMLCRNMSPTVKFHVYTEKKRPVPGHMIKHELTEWPGISGPKKSWWYKMQLFNSDHHQGNLLYFDLDTVILRDVSWIAQLPTEKFWSIKDFRHLQSDVHAGINSSIMWWNVPKFDWVYRDFIKKDLHALIRQYSQGDQEYLTAMIGDMNIRFFDSRFIQSWRWQAYEGGMMFPSRKTVSPGTGTHVNDNVAVLVFHGQPKPHEMTSDVVVKQHWQ